MWMECDTGMNKYDDYWLWCDEEDGEELTYNQDSVWYFLMGVIPLVLIIIGGLYLVFG